MPAPCGPPIKSKLSRERYLAGGKRYRRRVVLKQPKMATHTNGTQTFGRRFMISRQNGQANKNGRPFFFEWVSQLPQDQTGRLFETRNRDSGPAHYELFAALDGFLVGIEIESKVFNGTQRPEKWLILKMQDGIEQYQIEVGRMDSRWSMDIMKRLLDVNFIPNHKLRLSPFAMQDGEKWNIGISAISGTDGKLSAKRDGPHLIGMPEPETATLKGQTMWDFTPVADWLFARVQQSVIPKLGPIVEPINTKITASPAANTLTPEGFPDGDDLPF